MANQGSEAEVHGPRIHVMGCCWITGTLTFDLCLSKWVGAWPSIHTVYMAMQERCKSQCRLSQ